MISIHTRRSAVVCAGWLALGVLTSTCSPAPPPAPPPNSELWGEMKSVVSVKELMRDMLDPLADNIFDAVSTVVTKDGTVDMLPKTDADWDKIRIGAVSMAEGSYLLKVPRPFAPPGDENNSTGPDAEELSPAQIMAKFKADPVLWNAKIEALRNVGLEVLELVKTRDANGLWEASNNLDEACENCHVEYWYPGEKELLKKLDSKLQDLYGKVPRPDRSR